MPGQRQQWTTLLLLISTLTLAACGFGGPVAHATGARDIVVRLTSPQGGMLPAGLYYHEGQFPAFTLFGDGTLVYATNGGLYQARLDEAAIQRLLGVAVNDARFFDLGDFVGPTCCDMPGSQLTINAGGKEKTVGLSIIEDTSDGNSPEGRMLRLINAINALRTGKDQIYTPAGATVYAETPRGQTMPAATAWPLAQVSLAAVVLDSEGLHLTGADAQAALQAAPGVTPFIENGVSYLVIAVPDSP
jgi:hypothetical protein